MKRKNEFKGFKAVTKLLDNGIETKLVYLEVEAKDADAHGNEPVYFDDKKVGLTTSGAYGFRVKKSLAFAYVKPEYAKIGNKLFIEIQGEKIKAKIINEPAFDKNNDRLKS